MKPSFVIVGLGNPGASYEKTRHNIGFQAVDVLAKTFGGGKFEDRQKFLSHVLEVSMDAVPALLVKPQNFMNCSGEAIRNIVEFYKIDPKKQILVLCDDIDLPLGETRLRMKGGPGTHNGLKSIVQIFGEEFPRLRIGLGSQPPGADLAAWVLSVPSTDDRVVLKKALESLPDIVKEFVQ